MKKAQNGAKTPTDKEKTDAAIKAQKAKRDAAYAAEEARRAKNLEANRRARLPLAEQAALKAKTKTTTLPAGSGSMRKYMNAGTNPFGSTKGPVKVGGKTDSPAPKKSGSGGGKRKVTRTASAAVSAPKREMPSMMSKPSVPGVSKGPEKREYSKTESKIAGELQKMKSGKNAEASQARIKALKAKDASQKMRAEKKAKRMEKRAAVKDLKKSYK
jgi:hypothetical protein